MCVHVNIQFGLFVCFSFGYSNTNYNSYAKNNISAENCNKYLLPMTNKVIIAMTSRNSKYSPILSRLLMYVQCSLDRHL